MREAPSIVVVNALLEAGVKVRAYDPVAHETARKIFGDRIEYAASEYDATQGADALAVMTEWIDFRTPDFPRLVSQLRDKVIFDGRNLFEPEFVRKNGLAYYGIGK